MPIATMLMCISERRPKSILRLLQAVHTNVRRSADEQFREGLGLVLLDLGDRKCHSMELETGFGGWYTASQGI